MQIVWQLNNQCDHVDAEEEQYFVPTVFKKLDKPQVPLDSSSSNQSLHITTLLNLDMQIEDIICAVISLEGKTLSYVRIKFDKSLL